MVPPTLPLKLVAFGDRVVRDETGRLCSCLTMRQDETPPREARGVAVSGSLGQRGGPLASGGTQKAETILLIGWNLRGTSGRSI